MDKLKNTKILGIIGHALLIIGVFLPFYTVSIFGISQSVSYIQGDGKIVLVSAIIALLMILYDKIPALNNLIGDKINLSNQKLTLIPTAVSALLLIISFSNTSSFGTFGGHAIGFWLMILGVVAATIYPFLYKGEN